MPSYKGLLLSLLILLPGCASYQPKLLIPLTHQMAFFEDEKENVNVRVYPLDRKDANALFDGRGHYLFKNRQGYCPIQITIFNKTPEFLMLMPENISLKLVHPNTIIKAMEFDVTAHTVIPLVIGAAGLAATAIASPGRCQAATVCDTAAIGITSGVMATAGNADSQDANSMLAQDVYNKTLSPDGLVIKPYKKNSILIFVPARCMQDMFTLALTNQDGKLLFFDVSI